MIGDEPLICIYDDMQVKQACEAVHSAVSNWAGAPLHERPLQPAGKRGNFLLPGPIRGLAASIARPPAAAQPPRASTSSLMGLAAGGSSLAGRPAGGPRIFSSQISSVKHASLQMLCETCVPSFSRYNAQKQPPLIKL